MARKRDSIRTESYLRVNGEILALDSGLGEEHLAMCCQVSEIGGFERMGETEAQNYYGLDPGKIIDVSCVAAFHEIVERFLTTNTAILTDRVDTGIIGPWFDLKKNKAVALDMHNAWTSGVFRFTPRVIYSKNNRGFPLVIIVVTRERRSYRK